MTSGVYDYAFFHFGIGEINWTVTTGSVIYCALSVTTQPVQTHSHYNNIAAEVSGGGYTAGGNVMTLVTAAYSAGTPAYVVFDANDTVFATFSATCRWAIPYKLVGSHSGDDATMPLVSFHDFGATTGGGGNFTVVWDGNGVVRLTTTTAT